MQTPWEYRYSQRTQRMKASAIRELLAFAERPGMISFGGGFPAPDVFPVEEFKRACNTVLDTKGPEVLQYGSTDGYVPLREMISRHSIRSGMNVDISNILITSGSNRHLTCWARFSSTAGTASWSNPPPTWVRCKPGTPTEPITLPSLSTSTG